MAQPDARYGDVHADDRRGSGPASLERASRRWCGGGCPAAGRRIHGPGERLAAPTVAPSTVAPTTVGASVSSVAPVTTLATPDPPSGQLAQLVASTQQALRQASGSAPVPSNLRPSLASARERSKPYRDGCVNIGANSQLQPCEYGVPDGGRTILLYGDSHAVQWFEPLEQIALQRGWRLVVLAKGGCPVAEVDVPTPVLHYTCPPYRDRAIAWIAQHQPELVVVANSYTQYPADHEQWADGTEATIDRLSDAGSSVVLIGDNPASTLDPPACLSEHVDDVVRMCDVALRCRPPRADLRRGCCRSHPRGDVRRHHRLVLHRRCLPGRARKPARDAGRDAHHRPDGRVPPTVGGSCRGQCAVTATSLAMT